MKETHVLWLYRLQRQIEALHRLYFYINATHFPMPLQCLIQLAVHFHEIQKSVNILQEISINPTGSQLFSDKTEVLKESLLAKS